MKIGIREILEPILDELKIYVDSIYHLLREQYPDFFLGKQKELFYDKNTGLFVDRRVNTYNKDDIVYHRKDGPAVIQTKVIHNINPERRPGNGEIYIIFAWYLNGIMTREDGPAEIIFEYELDVDFNPDKYDVLTLTYYKNGNIHRDDGPATIKHCRNRSFKLWYYENGKERHIQYVKELKKYNIKKAN